MTEKEKQNFWESFLVVATSILGILTIFSFLICVPLSAIALLTGLKPPWVIFAALDPLVCSVSLGAFLILESLSQ